ncbi:type IV pilus assembly protein PilM [Planctomicrobium sp. SH668]|uniref:type IV pilus assembly protein PilM n=1 Tax=Planctomicrobium sp. SH668 TaxID=3448126 RepID=UPI003F5B97CA
MADNRASWGIDIGQSALKAIKIRHIADGDQIVAEAFDYIQYPKILSQPDAIPDEIVASAMETFLGRNSLKGDSVSISVAGKSALARFIQLPPVEASKLHEIVKYEARQQIPFALEDVIWDYQPLGAGAEESGFLLDAEVGLFAMKKDQIYQQLRPYNAAKVEVDLIQIEPLNLYNMLSVDTLGIRRNSTQEPSDEYVIALDMGCDSTTMVASNGFKIWIRSVSIGGNHFTRALTKEMKLSFAKAEHLKCNATKSPDPRAVFQALRPVFNDYVSEIQRSIGYFSSVNRSAKISKVIGFGNGFKLAGLQKFLQQNLQYEVDRPDSFQRLSGDAVLNSPLFSENVLSFAVPYGLALQGLNQTRIRTSLLPPEITAARRIRKKKPWAVATAASLLAGLSLATAANARSYSVVAAPGFVDAEKDADSFAAEVGGFKSSYDAAVANNTSIKEKLDSLTLNRRDISWIELYNAIIECLPREVGETEVAADDIASKNQISISQFSAERMSDLAPWYDALTQVSKDHMTVVEKEAGPSEAGYIVTLRGSHYHHNPNNPEEQGVLYVINHFLKNLQKFQVEQPGFPIRDVARMGISHATIVDHSQTPVMYNPQERESATAARIIPTDPVTGTPGRPGMGPSSGQSRDGFQPGLQGGSFPLGGGVNPLNPGTSLGGMGANGQQSFDPANTKELIRTDFVIQFAFKYIPQAERKTAEEAAAEAAEAAAAAESDSDDSDSE